MRFGSWPGPSYSNGVIKEICAGLEQYGHSIEEVNPVKLRLSLLRIDTLIVHWPEAVIWAGGSRLRRIARAISFLMTLAWLKSAGCKIVWIAHNLRPHDYPPEWAIAWPPFFRGFLCLVSGWMTLSPSTRKIFIKNYPVLARKPSRFAWHPSYRISLGVDRQTVRRQLGLPASDRILLMAGNIRRYKQIDRLIEVFKKVPDVQTRLLIVGAAGDASYIACLKEAAAGDPRIELRFGQVPDSDYEAYLIASDLFVVPFADVTHSGSIIHALSAGLPVLTRSLPFTEDLARLVGPQWIQLFTEDLAVTDLMRGEGKPERAPNLAALSATKFGEVLSELATELQDTGRPSAHGGRPQHFRQQGRG